MAQSKEYPDLQWIPPRAYGKGRDGKSVKYIVIHYTAGSERATSAEDGARYNQTRRDGTSAHYFVDQDSVVQGVLTSDRANCARHRGNRLGIQYELCGTVQTRAQWLDTASRRTLQLAAEQVARDCEKYGIPVRRLTVEETRRAWTSYPNGPKGIVGHVDCTYAYPEDGGDHTDPGAGFPWDVFLGMVRDEMEGLNMNESRLREILREELKPVTATVIREANEVSGEVLARTLVLPDGRTVSVGTVLRYLSAAEEDTRKRAAAGEEETRQIILAELAKLIPETDDEQPTT